MKLLALTVCLLAVTAVASNAATSPAQRLVNYVYAHAAPSDARSLRGLSLVGGRVVVVNGSPTVRGVQVQVLTRLRDTRAATFTAKRLCLVTLHGLVKIKVQGLAGVVVTDTYTRGGDIGNPPSGLAESTFEVNAVTHQPMNRLTCVRDLSHIN